MQSAERKMQLAGILTDECRPIAVELDPENEQEPLQSETGIDSLEQFCESWIEADKRS